MRLDRPSPRPSGQDHHDGTIYPGLDGLQSLHGQRPSSRYAMRKSARNREQVIATAGSRR